VEFSATAVIIIIRWNHRANISRPGSPATRHRNVHHADAVRRERLKFLWSSDRLKVIPEARTAVNSGASTRYCAVVLFPARTFRRLLFRPTKFYGLRFDKVPGFSRHPLSCTVLSIRSAIEIVSVCLNICHVIRSSENIGYLRQNEIANNKKKKRGVTCRGRCERRFELDT